MNLMFRSVLILAAVFASGVDARPRPKPAPAPAPAPAPPPPSAIPASTPASILLGAGADKLVINVSQTWYQAGAQYSVSVDGQAVGGVLTAQAIRSRGQVDTVTISGNWSAGTHTASVNFINDAWDGVSWWTLGLSADLHDRSLYVPAASFNGQPLPVNLVFAQSGAQSFAFTKAAPPVPTPSPTPGPAPTPTGLITPIASNFDTATELRTAWDTGAIPPVVTEDPVGAFRFVCYAGQLLYDDPIAYPGQPGKSHLHQFYGNLAANGNSTYASLRASGGSTCEGSRSVAVNRSAYWIPAMLDGAGSVVRPDFVALYYKGLPQSDARCHAPGRSCVGIPTGLKWIAGYNMGTRQDDKWAMLTFYCDYAKGQYRTIAEALADCPASRPDGQPMHLTAALGGPSCWDGKNLDSADHRSHVAMASPYDGTCDDAHPVMIAKVSINTAYQIDASFRAGKWHFSSDEMVPGATAGRTFHGDYFEAWDPTIRETWQLHCIDEHRSAAGGDLCNGTQIRDAYISNPAQTVANPRLVPVPRMTM